MPIDDIMELVGGSRAVANGKDPLQTNEHEVARFTESFKGNPMLLDKDGYPFKTSMKRGRKIYWICRDKVLEKCPARAVTNGIHVSMWSHTHNHARRPNSKNYNRKYQIQDKRSKKIWKQELGGI